MKTLIATLCAALLTGCGTLDAGKFQNRLMFTAACDEVRVDSQWFGLFGVSTPIVAKDGAPVLAARCGGPAGTAPAAAASGAK